MKNDTSKLSEDVIQIGVSAAAGAGVMYLGEKFIQVPLQNNIRDWRNKFIDLKDAGKIEESKALENQAPLGAKNISASEIKNIAVLSIGVLAKAVIPNTKYSNYATDGIILFALADLLTTKFGKIAYQAEFGKE